MAQAEQNLTTRRGFSKWLAAMGAAAVVPTVAISTPIRAQLLEALSALDRASQLHTEACQRSIEAQCAVERWRKRYPLPTD